MKCDCWFDDKHKPEQCKNVAIWNLKIDKKGLSGWENDKAKFCNNCKTSVEGVASKMGFAFSALY